MLKRIGYPLICFSPFDADAFMGQTVDAPLSTQYELPPEGDYKAMVDDFDNTVFRTFTSNKDGKDYTIFSPPFVIQDDALAASLGREKVIVYHKGMFIDMDAQGGIDKSKGKNVDLGKMREACGQNGAGPWSFAQLKGAGPFMVHVTHETDKTDTEKKYAKVNRVVKIG